MLYKKTKELTKEVFANPGSEYRGTPFWAWNCRMDKENIDRTIESLKAMGMGGGHIHCRTGMDASLHGGRIFESGEIFQSEIYRRGNADLAL